jgi:hypothetical protein
MQPTLPHQQTGLQLLQMLRRMLRKMLQRMQGQRKLLRMMQGQCSTWAGAAADVPALHLQIHVSKLHLRLMFQVPAIPALLLLMASHLQTADRSAIGAAATAEPLYLFQLCLYFSSFVCLLVWLFACLFVCLSVCLFVCLFVFFVVHLPFRVFQFCLSTTKNRQR